MANEIDVLAAVGSCRMETAAIAAKCGVKRSVVIKALRAAESVGDIEQVRADGTFWRRGAARPLIWQATKAGISSAMEVQNG